MLLVNGLNQNDISAQDRGLLYGDGVWETIAVRKGLPQLIEWHVERLLWGIQALAIKGLEVDLLQAEIQQICTSNYEYAVLKIIITRGLGLRGYNPNACATPTRILQLTPTLPYPSTYASQGIRLALCQTRLAHQPRLAGFKHLNRLEQVIARAEVGTDYQEGLLLNYEDQVIEGTMSNLFVITHDNQVYTPDLTNCGIAGVMRRFIIQALADFGIACHIRPLNLAEIRSAQTLFITNSLIGLWPVQEFMGHIYEIAPLVKSLQLKVDAIT